MTSKGFDVASMSRRGFVGASLASAAGFALPRPALAQGLRRHTLRFGSPLGANTTYHQAMTIFADELAKASDNRFKVELYPSSQLGGLKDMLNAVQLGTQSMLITVPAWFSSFVHQMDVLNLPFLIAAPDRLRTIFTTPFGQQLTEHCSKAGFKLMAAWLTGPRQMVNNVRPITAPKDLQGVKLRSIASPVFIDTFRLLGANPVVMDTSEVYLGLQQHAIDGMENPWTDIVTGKFYEVSKYLSNTAHMTDFFIPAMNQQLWDGMNAAEQRMVSDAMDKATQWQWSEQPKALDAALAKLKTVMTANDLTAEQHAAFVQATRPIYAKFEPSLGKDLIDLAIKTLS